MTTKKLTAREIAEDTAYLGKVLNAATQVEATARLARDFTDSGLQATVTDRQGGRSPEIPDPTGNAASIRPLLGDLELELAAAWRRLLVDAALFMAVHAKVWQRAARIDRQGAHSFAPQCANQFCNDEAVRIGRCKPCADYRDVNDRDAPEETVQARSRARKHRAGAV